MVLFPRKDSQEKQSGHAASKRDMKPADRVNEHPPPRRTEREKKLLNELAPGQNGKPDQHHSLAKVLALEQHLRSHDKYRKLFHDSSERDSMTDDPTLTLDLVVIHTFLVAKQFRFATARKYMTDWIEWRLKAKPHKIQLRDVWQEYISHKAYWYGHDKQGLPILTIRPHFHDPKKSSVQECGLFFTWIAEDGVCIIKESEKGKCVAIFDATKISLKNVDLKTFRAITSIIVMYPEVLEYALVLTTKAFAMLWKVGAPFLDSNTKRKIRLIGSNEEIFRFIDRDQVESDFGGSSSFDFDEHLRSDFDASSTV